MLRTHALVDFNKAFDSYQAPLPVLYQSGYLTIKSYEEDIDMYTLGFSNEEVRKGFAQIRDGRK